MSFPPSHELTSEDGMDDIDLWRRDVERLTVENEWLRHERDEAIRTRENANTVSVRVEAENKRLREDLADADATLKRLGSENRRLREAIKGTLCDDEPCPRCDDLRAVLRGTTNEET